MYYIQLYPFIESIELLIQKGLHKQKDLQVCRDGPQSGWNFFSFLMWERERGRGWQSNTQPRFIRPWSNNRIHFGRGGGAGWLVGSIARLLLYILARPPLRQASSISSTDRKNFATLVKSAFNECTRAAPVCIRIFFPSFFFSFLAGVHQFYSGQLRWRF